LFDEADDWGGHDEGSVVGGGCAGVLAPESLGSPGGCESTDRNCPPAFQGPHTFAEVIEMWPPPPGFPDPEGALAGYDKNGDGSLCVLPLPGGTDINVIDNSARVP
jgi:hypothetical protein